MASTRTSDDGTSAPIESRVVLPCYFVVDRSASLRPYKDELNSGLVEMLNEVQIEPLAASKIRLSIIAFSDEPQLLLEPSDLRFVDSIPHLEPGGRTNYGRVFRFVKDRVGIDIPSLKHEGWLVTRPAVFFLTDGNPTDASWEADVAALQDESFKYRPNILAFGIGEVNPRRIRRIATSDDFAFVANDKPNIGDAISSFVESLVSSLVASGQALASGSAELPIAKPEGFSLAIDILD